MGKRLSDDEIQRFRREGFLFPIQAYAPDQIATFLSRLEEIEASRAGRLPPSLNVKAHLLIPWLWDIVHDPRIVDAVEDLLGPDILCWGTSFISKRGEDGRYVTWHQDATHWHLSEPRAVTAWIAFTPSTKENGCVLMLPGTNRAMLTHKDNGDKLNMLGMREEVDAALDTSGAVALELAPGQMSLHDPLVVHGSGASRSTIRRTGFAIRYIPASVSQQPGLRNSATLVRGRDHGHYELESPPEDLFHPDAVRRHGVILRRGMEVIFGTPQRL